MTSSSVSGVEPPEASGAFYVPFGTLTIELGDRAGQLVFDPVAAGAATVTQPLLNQQPCNQVTLGSVTSGVGDLLSLVPLVGGTTGPGDSVQQPGEFFGIQTAGQNCGRQAEVIAANELLEIALGTFDGFNSTVRVRSLTAAVDKKFNNDGNLTVGFDGGTQDLTKSVATGGGIVSISGTDIPGGVFESVTLGSTSNRDNRGLSIGDATLQLVTPSSDYEVAVFCGEKVTESATTANATKATYLRGQNDDKNGPNACEDVGVVVEVQGDKVYWDNSLIGVDGNPQRVQGTITIEWAPVFTEGLTPTQINDKLEREIDYDGPGTAAGTTESLWCESFTNESDFTLPKYSGPGANTNGTTETTDDTAPWCLVSDTRVLRTIDGKPAIVQTEVLAGKGDPWRF